MKAFIKILFIITLIQNISHAEKINLIKKNGVYHVPVVINDSIKLNFVVDSGAARVSMPYDVFRTLMRTGSITQNDILGKEQYRMADGAIAEGFKVNIRSMKIGNQKIFNVLASVDKHMNGMLLLGQSALQKLEPWNMDTKKEVLYIKNVQEEKKSKSKLGDLLTNENSSEKKTNYRCNDVSECVSLANDFQLGLNGKEQSYKEAIKYYIKACDYGDARSCSNAGYIFGIGDEVTYNVSKEIEFSKKACMLDHSYCESLGDMYAYGIHVKQDYIKSKNYLKLACDSEDIYACALLDEVQAIDIDKKSNTRNETLSCTNVVECLTLAHKYNQKYNRFDGNRIENHQKAIKYYGKSCDYGKASSCFMAGRMLKFGEPIKYGSLETIPEAIDYYEKACSLDNNYCGEIGSIYAFEEKRQNKDKAIKYFKLACESGQTYYCSAPERFKLIVKEEKSKK